MSKTTANTPTAPIQEAAVPTAPPVRELTEVREAKLELVEGSESGGRFRVKGEFARCDVPTQNKRVYPRELWLRESKRLSEALGARRVFGELDHPSDGKTQLSRVSHVVTKITVRDDGIVEGEAEILDTARGRDLKALFKSGCAVGISSRGYGATEKTEDGNDRVTESYRLGTFDFVADPADMHAYPQAFAESAEIPKEASAAVQALIDEAVTKNTEKVETQLREQFKTQLPKLLAKVREEALAEARESLLNDPEVAGALKALESIKGLLRPFVLDEDAAAVVSEKEAALAELSGKLEAAAAKQTELEKLVREAEEERDEIGSLARLATYQFFVEKTLSGSSDSELVKTTLGDLSGYKTIEDLKVRMESITKELSDRRLAEAKAREEREAEIQAVLEKEREQWKAQLKEAEERAAKAERLAEKRQRESEEASTALEESQLVALHEQAMAYAERRLRGNPRVKDLRRRMVAERCTDRSEVDAILAEDKAENPDVIIPEEQESVRARVRRVLKGGKTTLPEEEEMPPKPIQEGKEPSSNGSSNPGDYNGLGVSLSDLHRLTGINNPN